MGLAWDTACEGARRWGLGLSIRRMAYLAWYYSIAISPQPYTVTLNTHWDPYFNFLQLTFCPVIARFKRLQQFIYI